MAYEHPSGVQSAWDRAHDNPSWARVVAREDRLAQATEINDLQTIGERKTRRVGDMIARDGDRIEGTDIAVIRDLSPATTGTIHLTAGKVYVRGDVRPVIAADIPSVSLAGDVVVGVRLSSIVITEEDDPSLLGLEPGTEAEGEPGAVRVAEALAWAIQGDSGEGDFFGIYLVRDGDVIDQSPPPSLSGVNQAIATYDRDANGSYIVTGCRLTALGKIGADQVFTIEEGVANIYGFKRTRYSATRFPVLEEWTTEQIDAEPHTFADGGAGTVVLTLNRGPIAAINTVIVTKQVTETIVRGTPNNTADPLGQSGVTEIISVTQGATTFVETTSYILTGDSVNWSPGGAEPSGGSSYDVTYRYLDAVTPSAITARTVAVSGGVTGTTVLVGYTWKLPRIDIIGLNEFGEPIYVKGIPSRDRPVAPIAPVTVLKLAEITNNWVGAPSILNNGIRAYPYSEIDRMYNRLFDALVLVSEERLKRDIDSREPVAKRGVFVDPFDSDRYRDAGELQTAAVFDGSCQLAIMPSFISPAITSPVSLDWTEEIIVSQELATSCMKINPYMNFNPLPASLALTPAVDFWTESGTEWASPQTQEFGRGNQSRTTVRDVLVDQREQQAEFLRTIQVAFTIEGFGPGEILSSLKFDGIDVTPPGSPVADSLGEISGNFDIPANVTAGHKSVVAEGAGSSHAQAVFVGQGTIEIGVMQRVTTIERWEPPQWEDSGGESDGSDPLAQTFAVPEPRHIAGIDIKFCAIGDPANACLLELVTVENGIPTSNVMTSKIIPVAGVTIGEWVSIRFDLPVFLLADREYAVVVKTDDAEHSLSVGQVGDFDANRQEWVSAQPYTVGVLLSSSNAKTWTPHQNADLTFRLVAAKFAPIIKTVNLGDHSISNISDLLIRATVELPTADASLYFEIERPGGEVIRLNADQTFEFTSFITETVQFRAVLRGSEKISPVLYPGVLLVLGEIQTGGTYISRAFTMGSAIRLAVLANTKLPQGSSLLVEVDAADDVWQAVALVTSAPLNDGWIERQYEINPFTAIEGRVRLTLTGGPGARPSLSDLRAVSI